MTVAFTLDALEFVALNGGPQVPFTCAVSFAVTCKNQTEIDYDWDRLSAGGNPSAQRCGWLADRFGLSWQIVPANLSEMLSMTDPAARSRTMDAILSMKKSDLAALAKTAEP
jgi:predicted 3-demethylubiquinone-9 3-methyltransferase (glyoxalase superfamily)